MPQPAPATCLLLADDLTGACDAAVHFAMRGYATVVRLSDAGSDACPGGGVLAISTETRGVNPLDLRAVYAETARRLSAIDSRILFKKIDSTLRGNAGMEAALAVDAFGCDTAVMTPAFPVMGRSVDLGVLRAPGCAPIGMERYWREQGLGGCVHVTPCGVRDAIDGGARFVSVDAASEADLDQIAAAGLASRKRVLWTGSAGLASAIARILPRGPEPAPLPPERHSAVLFCIGSDHPVTVEQERRLLASRRAVTIRAERAESGCVAEALRAGLHVALRIPCGRVAPDCLASAIGDARGPLLLTGGDTASLVWRALGMREIQLSQEVEPGIPWGSISGGLFDGVPVVTKSGGFGNPGSLIRITDFFTCQ